MNHLFESLKDKKIIIAGCNGYIGNAFAELLYSKNVKFTGIDKIDNVGEKPYLYNNFNLTNKNKLAKLISSVKPDIFFHFANFLNSLNFFSGSISINVKFIFDLFIIVLKVGL